MPMVGEGRRSSLLLSTRGRRRPRVTRWAMRVQWLVRTAGFVRRTTGQEHKEKVAWHLQMVVQGVVQEHPHAEQYH